MKIQTKSWQKCITIWEPSQPRSSARF